MQVTAILWSHTAWLVGKSENRAPKEVSKARRGRRSVRPGIDDSKPLILSSEEHHLYHQYHDYSYKVNNNWSSFIAHHPSNNFEPYFVTLSIRILSYTRTWIKNIIFRQKQEKGGEMAHCLRALIVLERTGGFPSRHPYGGSWPPLTPVLSCFSFLYAEEMLTNLSVVITKGIF